MPPTRVPEDAHRAVLPSQQQNGALFEKQEQAKPAKKEPVTFTIHALLDDFPIDVSFAGDADRLQATVARLREIGAVPPTAQARAAVQAEKERSAPACACEVCDRYGKAMKESTRRPGTYYCPGKIGMERGQPVYCKEKA